MFIIMTSVFAEQEEMQECRDGDVPCYVQTGHRLFDEKSYDEAISWFEKAGDSPHALDAIAFAYETGQGKVKDVAKAFSLYSEAAGMGYELAEFHLGNCYARGVGIGIDEAQASAYFKKAADKGHASAAYNYALRLYDGTGVTEDKMAAVKMFDKAAEAGHLGATYNVGVYYLSTRGPQQSDSKAVEYFTRAAKRNHGDSAVNLAMCYMAGRGVTKDREQAKRWLQVAAEQGHERGKQMFQQIQNEQQAAGLEQGLGNNKPAPGHKTFDDVKEEPKEEEGKGEEDL